MTAARIVAAALVVACGGVARAEPVVVHAERCASLDAAALGLAVARELALAPNDDRAARSIAVEIACPDGIHARVSVAPARSAAPLARDLDLSEEPGALRIKLVALAIAELVDELQTAPVAAAAAAPAPRPIATAEALDPEDAPSFVRAGAPIPARRNVTVRGGVRVIAGGPPMPTLWADLDAGLARLGLVAAVGDDHRSAGMPYFLGVTLGRSLVCARRTTSLCLVARGEAGFEGVSLRRTESDYMPHDVHATYADLALGFEARRRLAGWNWVAEVDLGAGDGLVFENAHLERLDGPFAVTSLGTSW